jgi:putative colanic acid biosynthesis acetyltransferase WcaF
MDSPDLDIGKNRSAKKYSRKELSTRILWAIVLPLFRFSPRNLFQWRNVLLRLFGAKIGKAVHIYPTAIVYMPWNLEIGSWSSIGEHVYLYNLGKIRIGSRATVSHRAHLCAGTHDYTRPDLPLLKPPICLEDEVWICADAFIGPGVTIGHGAVVGARCVVTKNVDAWAVMAGNPAQVVGERRVRSEE